MDCPNCGNDEFDYTGLDANICLYCGNIVNDNGEEL